MPAQLKFQGHPFAPNSLYAQILCPHSGMADYSGSPVHGYKGYLRLEKRKSMFISLKTDREYCDGLEEDDE